MATSAAYIDLDEGAAPATPAAGKVRVYAKTDGSAYQKDDAGTETGLAGGGGGGSGQGLVDFAFVKRTSGNVVFNNTSWIDFDTGTDLVLSAAAGDVVEVAASGLWNTEALNGMMDVATIAAAAPVNYLGATGGASDLGILAWEGPASLGATLGGGVMYTLQAGDISGGTVTLRLRVRGSAGANKTVFSTAAIPFFWSAKNIGPAL